MKYFLTITLFVFALNGSFSQILENPAEVKKDKVNTVVEMWYRYDVDGNMIPQGSKSIFERYDRNGNRQQLIKYIPGKGIDQNFIFKYSKKGDLIGETVTDGEEKLIDQKKYDYKKGLVSYINGSAPDNIYKIHNLYQDTLLTESVKKKNDKIISSKTFIYNNQNLLEKEIYTSGKVYTTIYEYNDLRQKTSETRFIDTSLNYTLNYSYDEKGRLKSEEKVDPLKRSLSTLIYNYDQSNRVKTISQHSNYLASIHKKWVYQYDGKGNIEKITMYDAEESIPVSVTKYIYRYYKE